MKMRAALLLSLVAVFAFAEDTEEEKRTKMYACVDLARIKLE
jgi:hypothetical protein